MDLAFFGLSEAPFNPAPDPRFLYLTVGHQEALAQILYGVQQRKGFLLLTGEVGTGKTTLLQALLEQLGDSTAVAFITNSALDFDGILEYALEDLGIAKPGVASPAQRLMALQRFLVERQRSGQNAILILDEAHGLDLGTLEQIRLLSNFEAAGEKIIQILLVGQPELRAKLDLPELRQLKQRIWLRCAIPPLAADEVRHYIKARLRVAGAQDPGLFSSAAVLRIAAYSRGIPRVVNAVCDHCLLFAYADQVRRIGPETVAEAIHYLDDGGHSHSRRHRPRIWRMTRLRWTVLAASAAAGLAALLAATLQFGPLSLAGLARSARALLPL